MPRHGCSRRNATARRAALSGKAARRTPDYSSVTPDLFRGPTGNQLELSGSGKNLDAGFADGWMPEQVRHDESG